MKKYKKENPMSHKYKIWLNFYLTKIESKYFTYTYKALGLIHATTKWKYKVMQ